MTIRVSVKQVSLLLASVLIVAIATFAWVRVNGAPPMIEKFTDPETMPVWQSSGAQRGSVVCFLDRRKTGMEIYYYDRGNDRIVDTVMAVSEGRLVRYEIVGSDEAKMFNTRSAELKWYDGRTWLTRDDPRVLIMQQQYEEVLWSMRMVGNLGADPNKNR